MNWWGGSTIYHMQILLLSSGICYSFFFNQYLISRLSSAKKRNIVDEKRVFQKDWTDIRYVYD